MLTSPSKTDGVVWSISCAHSTFKNTFTRSRGFMPSLTEPERPTCTTPPSAGHFYTNQMTPRAWLPAIFNLQFETLGSARQNRCSPAVHPPRHLSRYATVFCRGGPRAPFWPRAPLQASHVVPKPGSKLWVKSDASEIALHSWKCILASSRNIWVGQM